MSGEKPCLHPVIYKSINENLAKGDTLKTRGSGSSGLHTDGWRRILAFNSYGTVNVIDLWKAFAKFLKNINIIKIEKNAETKETSLEAL